MIDAADAPGVKVTDPAKRAVGAYPLPILSYAAVNVCASSTSELKDYSKLISYASGKGQISGDARGSLPRGYVPLGADSIAMAQSVAAGLMDKKSVAKDCGTTSTADPTPTPTPTSTPTPAQPAPSSSTPAIVVPAPVPTETSSSAAVSSPAPDPDTQTVAQKTVDLPLSNGRAGLAGALALGIPSMIAGPLLSRRGRKLAALTEDES
jgi:hypothetical protein